MESKEGKRYLDKNDLDILNINDHELKTYDIVSNDTINEEDLRNIIINSSYKNELLAASIQMAIVGFGGNSYNQYIFKGETKELTTLFRNANIKYNNVIQSKLATTDLTPRRLLRIFRNQIKKYLELKTNQSSYLFNKYGENNPIYRTICFSGAEYMVENQNEADYLLNVYAKLDDDLEKRNIQTGILLRINRVLLSKGFRTNL
jgi:hypothetical protein